MRQRLDRYVFARLRVAGLAVFIIASSLFSTSQALAATFIQTANATATSGTTVSASFSPAAIAGHMLVAVVGASGNTTITGPAGWSTAINESGAASQGIFYKRAVGGETAVSASVSTNPGSIGIHIYEYSSANLFDRATSNSGSSTAQSSGTITTTQANELILAGFTSAGQSTNYSGWSAGYTARNAFRTTGANKAAYGGADNLTNSAGSQSTNATAGNGPWRGQIVSFQNDVTPPTVTGVTSTALDGTYGIGAVIPIQVNFSKVVTVTGGTPQLTLSTGSPSTTTINYASGSGTSTLTFNYTVAAGNTKSDLDYASTTALALNSSTIQDSVGNNATLTLAAPGAAGSLGANKNIVIDGNAPTVTGVTSTTANGSYGAGTVIPIQVNFSEIVNVAGGAPQLTLSTGSPATTAITYASGSGSTTLVFSYTVASGNASIDLDYASTAALALNGSTIKDGAGNNAVLTLASPGAAGSLSANKNIAIDTAAPAAITDLATSLPSPSSIHLSWTAPGDDGAVGTAAAYAIRYSSSPITNDATYNAAALVSGTPAPAVAGTVQYMDVTGLAPSTTYYFAMKTSDEVPNTSALSNIVSRATLPVPDTTPPAAITDLATSAPTVTSVTLTWTAPGNDGSVGTASAYDVHYSTSPITDDASFNAATDFPGWPAPAIAGTVQSTTVTGLAANTTYYFAMRTADEVPNWSGLSNVVSRAMLAAPDVIPPAAVSDLALSSPSITTMTLTWTAPGDDSAVGTATSYNVRYSTAPIVDDATFNAAASAAGAPAPAIAGTVQSMTVTGLAAHTTYYFAIKTSDEVPNVSALSNVPSGSTLAAPDAAPPAAISDLLLSNATLSSIDLTWTAPGDDGAVGTATSYNVRYSTDPIVTDTDFTNATAASGAPTPAIAGTVQTMTVTGLASNRAYYFAIKTSDEVPNVSALSNAPHLATLAPPDTTPPANITTLALSSPTTTSIALTWTAPGNDGAVGTATAYDVHYSTTPIVTLTDFDAGTDFPGWPAPAIAGTVQSVTVTGLSSGTTYYFAMRAADAVPNWSGLSNIPSLATLVPPDVTPPAAVTDLAITNPTRASLDLTWTAPGDDGVVGTATSYDIRYSTSPIVDDATFAGATPIAGAPVPAIAGTMQSLTVPGLDANTAYYFAMKTSDEVPNVSSLSNVPTQRTLPPAGTGATRTSSSTDLVLSMQASPSSLNGSGDVTFVYTVRNVGPRHISDVVVRDDLGTDSCAPVTFISGDADGDGILDPNGAETWTFTCVEHVTASVAHTAVASGTWNFGTGTSNPAAILVPVGPVTAAAELHLHIKSYPSVLHPTGEPVSFLYTVGNLGDTPVSDIHFSGGACDLVKLVFGDANKDGLLDPSETWTYSCDAFISATMVRTVVVTGMANGTPVSDSTTVQVPVGSAIPNPHIHLHVVASPARLPLGGGQTYLLYHVYNDGTRPLSGVKLIANSPSCQEAKYQDGDTNGNHILDLNEVWTYSCLVTITKTEVGAPVVSGSYTGTPVYDDALFIVPVSATQPATTDATLTGPYDRAQAEKDTPDIDTNMALAATTTPAHCIAGVPYKLANDNNPETQNDSTVYYCGRDGMRHPFPNAKVFFSWYPDFRNIRIIDRATLESIPLGALVQFRPGVRLIKAPSDAKVYAVSRNGVLRWVTSESLVSGLYGPNWKMMIDDIPEAFMNSYTIGAPIQ